MVVRSIHHCRPITGSGILMQPTMTAATERVKELIIRLLKEDLTDEENTELQRWAHSTPENMDLYQQLTDPDRLAADLREFHEARMSIHARLDAVVIHRTELAQEEPVLPKYRIPRRTWAFRAAAIIILLAT